ncbi:MAG: 2-alkenal reductase [Gammaproteobacteria bacterium]|uniref:2-alkenal reductase n=1 Tax=OM182 bacterium MED-G24 TaxID=1986255 RepID=A0A2A5X0U6_9GAMM|nr:2-alkenal reductase [Gammaproteobacteria bacterium]PDH41936.1 MAG: 2-alkenal reductase [OM182 bacterium MED-G24]RPG27479.1 MAG: PDZ domain-containing protein [Gammaproteobacteria bacterium TMED50]|tara:strand:+ start:12831 stop:13940 length:1110 start_codon:yes stop_codon:yes gene_type:complete
MLKQYIVPALVLVVCAAAFNYFSAGFTDADVTTSSPVLGPAITDPSTLTSDENNNIGIYRETSPSVVFVTNTQLRRRLFSLNVMEAPAGSGTGFVWSDSGLIVTNYHVVHAANRINITLTNGNSYQAELVGAAPEKDIALLRIDAPDETLTPIPLGNSDALSVGRKVLAIGNPFALDTTLTVGVVSALGREIQSPANRTIKNVIQTDAAINPGNSGGPLLNSMGEVVGVNTAIYSPSGASAGIGFAIPVNAVSKIVPQLIEHGRLYRPVLGIETMPDRWAAQLRVQGVAVTSVVRGSGADRAGMVGVREDRFGKLHFGDIIIAINDDEVISNDSLLTALETYKPGDEIKVTTRIDDEIREYQVVLDKPK